MPTHALSPPMFTRILIANRGEIACRIAATCRRLGVESVAVYSRPDRHARHVEWCDHAFALGGDSAAESYLDIPRILAAARASGAEAIHPGYGFLSENAAFAQACVDAGFVFIGPSAQAIAAMGSKAAAKQLMQSVGVPLLPGYHGEAQDADTLRREAETIAYPVLLKASAGGGGRGMRIVQHAADFDEALATCQREAFHSFGDARILLERYVARARHVEVQLLADRQGHTLALSDRDCSVQRRHQKVLEEAPAPALSAATRTAMRNAAVSAARAVAYVGAGTVEFLLEADDPQASHVTSAHDRHRTVESTPGTNNAAHAPARFYFMEMNTRLQVEHPVTEAITGCDLVEWQLRVAAGEALPWTQDSIPQQGHAIEARLYAENPLRDFLPSSGTLQHLHLPAASTFCWPTSIDSLSSSTGSATAPCDGAAPIAACLRIDSGVRAGDVISPYYDAMIAKLVAYGSTREQALARMRAALTECEIVGLESNLPLLRRLLACPAYTDLQQQALDTCLIAREAATLLAPVPPPSRTALALASAAWCRDFTQADRTGASETLNLDPWKALPHWRLNAAYEQRLHWVAGENFHTTRLRWEGTECHYADDEDTQPMPFCWRSGATPDLIELDWNAQTLRARVVRLGDAFHVFHREEHGVLHRHMPHCGAEDDEASAGTLTAPMPGVVIAVLTEPGAQVEKGAPLMRIEAMKMEHTIRAPTAGTVSAVHYAVGAQVAEGASVLVFDAA